MTFRAQSDSDFEKVRKRKANLTVFECIVYAFLLIMMIVQILMIYVEDTLIWYDIFLVYSNFSALAFALTIFFAARHIHINSKQVESLGIRTSSTLIKLYVTFWIGLAICNFSLLILLICKIAI